MIVTILGYSSDVEVDKIGIDPEYFLIYLSGYTMDDGINMVEGANDKLFFSPYNNPHVDCWLLKGSDIPGIGLGHFSQGILYFPEPNNNPSLHELGYGKNQSDIDELKKFKQIQKMLYKAYRLPPSLDSLNGLFHKEGESKIFFGFKEFANGKLVTSWDIMFKTEPNEPLHTCNANLLLH